MRYRVHHTTCYRYESPVSQCSSEMRLTPRALPWQRIVQHRLDTVPAAASSASHTDYFGNAVTRLGILESHARFVTTATSVVEVDERPTPTGGPAWEDARAVVALHQAADTFEAFEFTCASPFVPALPGLAQLAAPSFTPGRGLVAAVEDLAHRIHGAFEYRAHSTSVETPLLETLQAGRGVCQDFAHVMIGALRSQGQAARYVSGYLRSVADCDDYADYADYKGAEASHAWVSVFVPSFGWLDIDPTNDVKPGTGHVTLAWGRDYGDVAPIRGVALGGGNQVVEVAVRVDAVTTASRVP